LGRGAVFLHRRVRDGRLDRTQTGVLSNLPQILQCPPAVWSGGRFEVKVQVGVLDSSRVPIEHDDVENSALQPKSHLGFWVALTN